MNGWLLQALHLNSSSASAASIRRNGDSLVWRITIPYTPVELRGESNGEMICVRSKNHILLRFLWPPLLTAVFRRRICNLTDFFFSAVVIQAAMENLFALRIPALNLQGDITFLCLPFMVLWCACIQSMYRA